MTTQKNKKKLNDRAETGIHQFKVIMEQDGDGYFVASVPALPGCHTQARTLSELRKKIREAIMLCLEVAKSDSQYRGVIRSLSYQPSFVGLETVSV